MLIVRCRPGVLDRDGAEALVEIGMCHSLTMRYRLPQCRRKEVLTKATAQPAAGLEIDPGRTLGESQSEHEAQDRILNLRPDLSSRPQSND